MSGEIEEAKDVGTDQAALAKRWLREIELSTQHEAKWMKRAKKIVERYRDEDRDSDKSNSRFNILYANVEVLKGVMYSRKPAPDVRRRYADKDPLGREAATVLQRALSYSIDMYDFDDVMKSVVEDVLLPGRAVARVKYKSQMGPAAEEGQPETVVYEAVECDYVEWEMFRCSPAKRWSKVRWVAFGELLTRDDLVKQFGDKGKHTQLDWAPKGKEEEKDELFKRALVWTIWDKTSKRVIVLSKGYVDAPLMVLDDPLGLENFFPCPKPVVSINTTNDMTPIPEYVQYQDQAIELDNITGRIDVLVDAMRRRGVYDASRPELQKISNAGDNEFIPVENLVAMLEKGGLENLIMEMPIDGIAKVLLQLYDQRDRVKQIIYEVTGIADVVRGASEASETLGAQELKSRYANSRIAPRQNSIANFARDLLRIKAEIIAEKFSPQSLAQITGVELAFDDNEKQMIQMQQQAMQQQGQQVKPDRRLNKPTWEQVMTVLRDDKLRGFKVDIETDSTIQPDADAEQKNRIEFLTAITSFAEKAGPMVQGGLIPIDIAKELMSFGVRAFKVSPQLEDALDQIGGSDEASPAKITELSQKVQQYEQQMQEMQQALKQAQQAADQSAGQLMQAKQQAVQAQSQAETVQAQASIKDQSMSEQRRLEQLSAKLEIDAMQLRFDQQLFELRQRAAMAEDKTDAEINKAVIKASADVARANIDAQSALNVAVVTQSKTEESQNDS